MLANAIAIPAPGLKKSYKKTNIIFLAVMAFLEGVARIDTSN
ncbi:hypothetical protein CLV51_11317 [Chitinophaga niastensis]|uniref:Uncharacterized protein n=1 Tax=Chitinophaga niastensis TaxID=536980 RepID=A0A2P8H864_CHINA|nr:hypothetical protein CLV51_11317 [Chitinophaga niastensis]